MGGVMAAVLGVLIGLVLGWFGLRQLGRLRPPEQAPDERELDEAIERATKEHERKKKELEDQKGARTEDLTEDPSELTEALTDLAEKLGLPEDDAQPIRPSEIKQGKP